MEMRELSEREVRTVSGGGVFLLPSITRIASLAMMTPVVTPFFNKVKEYINEAIQHRKEKPNDMPYHLGVKLKFVD